MLNRLLSTPSTEVRYNINMPTASFDIAASLKKIAQEHALHGQQILVLCIGSDRSTGDALGPLIGSKLAALRITHRIYGTLDEPVHAVNLSNTLGNIRDAFSNPFIIAVDACLGSVDNVGCVTIGRGSLKPGAAVNKELPPVGDVYITGIVNVGGFMEHLVLQSTRLNLVVKMADTIAHGIYLGLSDRRLN